MKTAFARSAHRGNCLPASFYYYYFRVSFRVALRTTPIFLILPVPCIFIRGQTGFPWRRGSCRGKTGRNFFPLLKERSSPLLRADARPVYAISLPLDSKTSAPASTWATPAPPRHPRIHASSTVFPRIFSSLFHLCADNEDFLATSLEIPRLSWGPRSPTNTAHRGK